jgi:putative addiction module killer protein
VFVNWLRALKDANAVARIAARIRRLELGNLGDVKPVGEGVSELRIDYGPGYRIYFVQQGNTVVIGCGRCWFQRPSNCYRRADSGR